MSLTEDSDTELLTPSFPINFAAASLLEIFVTVMRSAVREENAGVFTIFIMPKGVFTALSYGAFRYFSLPS